MTVKLIVPTAINLVAHVNETLVSARRRGFEGELELPSLRQRAKAAVYEKSVLKIETFTPTAQVGEFTS